MAGNGPTSRPTERVGPPTIMVVADDLKLLKLLDMALKLEMVCDVLPFASGRSTEETAKHITPDLVILDEHLLDSRAQDLADRLHSIPRLEKVPTLIINVDTVTLSERPSYPLMMLQMRWEFNEFYAAVYQLLDGTI